MKRLLALFIIVCLVLLSGCSMFAERIKEPVTFYYLRNDYQYFTQEGIFVAEEREASGHLDDLSYLLALYLMGPSEDSLKTPLPRGTWAISVEETDGQLTIRLSDHTKSLSDIDYSLACACLTLSFLELTDAQTVTISSWERSVTMSRDTLSFYDSSTAAEETQ